MSDANRKKPKTRPRQSCSRSFYPSLVSQPATFDTNIINIMYVRTQEIGNGSQESFGLTATVAFTLAPQLVLQLRYGQSVAQNEFGWKAKSTRSSWRLSFEACQTGPNFMHRNG